MQRNSKVILIPVFVLLIVLSLQACNLGGSEELELSAEERAQTLVAETMAVEYVAQTAVAGTMAALIPPAAVPTEPEAVEVPQPTATEVVATPVIATPTESFTPTPSVPMVMVSVDTNCRSGPGQQYDIIGALMVGEQAEVVGAAMGGGYWIIPNPDRAGECWLWANYATVVGQTEGLPKYTPPPTPTPVYNWTGTWTTSYGVTGLQHETIVINLTQTNTSVTGSFTFDSDVITLNGTLSADYMTLTGTWTQSAPVTSGPFVFKLINANQFVGNMNNGAFEWCGYRGGAGLPSPCMGP
jgi:hypothetical protein